jgi:probable rRNA maturation factor
MAVHNPYLSLSGEENLPSKDRKKILKVLDDVSRAAMLPEALLSVSFVDDQTMTALNKQWRKKNKTTDVLSFSGIEAGDMPGPLAVLGDIVISVDVAKKQATDAGHTLAEEIAVLFAHGILHVLGMDHERSEDEARMQAECEMAILDAAGLKPELTLVGRAHFYDEEKS